VRIARATLDLATEDFAAALRDLLEAQSAREAAAP
jgi:hypothetical protein